MHSDQRRIRFSKSRRYFVGDVALSNTFYNSVTSEPSTSSDSSTGSRRTGSPQAQLLSLRLDFCCLPASTSFEDEVTDVISGRLASVLSFFEREFSSTREILTKRGDQSKLCRKCSSQHKKVKDHCLSPKTSTYNAGLATPPLKMSFDCLAT